MSHHCSQGSCSTGGSGHMGSSSHSCGCCCHAGCACSCHKSHEESCCDKARGLLELADEAWMELLKDKIKENILASDHKIDEMARIVTEVNRELWFHKMGEGKTKEEYGQRLKELFSQPRRG